MANSSPPSRATKSVSPTQPAQAHGHGFQQFVADQVSERIVDAFEFVDVDIEHRQLLARNDPGQLQLELFVEQRAVRQIGQRVVMRQMRDALLGAPALGDVLQRGHPSAIEQRLVDDLDRRPSVVSTTLWVTFPAPRCATHFAQKSSTSPMNDPVCLRCTIRSRKLQPGFTTSGTARTSRYSAGCRPPAAAMNRTAAGLASCC
jgi:hypothetical protein